MPRSSFTVGNGVIPRLETGAPGLGTVNLSRIRIPRGSGGSHGFEKIASVHHAVPVRVRTALETMIRCEHFLGTDTAVLVSVGDCKEPIGPCVGRYAPAKIV